MCQTQNASFFVLLEEEQKAALCSTLSEILESACASPSTGFCLVTWAKGQSPHTDTQTQAQSQSKDVPEPASSQTPQEQQPSEFSSLTFSHCMHGHLNAQLTLNRFD